MKTKKTYAIFGLGRYGTAVARELVENGMEVIAVDTEQRIVTDAAAYLPVCKCADVTDAEVISRLGIGSIDTVIVCMASNLEGSVMAITLCKEAGVKNVIAKCANEMQQKILLRVGADHKKRYRHGNCLFHRSLGNTAAKQGCAVLISNGSQCRASEDGNGYGFHTACRSHG